MAKGDDTSDDTVDDSIYVSVEREDDPRLKGMHILTFSALNMETRLLGTIQDLRAVVREADEKLAEAYAEAMDREWNDGDHRDDG